MHKQIALNPNRLVQYLEKPAESFTKKDIIKYIKENHIEMLNFRYIAGDGRLKTLNFVINDLEHINHILSTGERVDGSSLFSYVDPSSSDLYVIPKFKTAYLNPFAEIPTVDILCSFYTADGKPLDSSPENLVKKAHKMFKEETGYTLEALGELEYYIFSEVDKIYPITEQKGYHESPPFSKWESIRTEAMQVISQIGGKIKYGHSEVGNIIHDGMEMVQQEIEFLPVPVEDAAEQLVLAKWALREIACGYGLEISFAPKIIVGHAGSGMHVHVRLMKDGQNIMVKDGDLSDEARKMIAGLLDLSPSLTGFGNTVPTSFLRLVPHQEAPTSICWGERNRSALIRVPLGWMGVDDMVKEVNPLEEDEQDDFVSNQTVELRSPDGSANIHNLMAGMTMAALHGFLKEDSLDLARKLYIDKDASKFKDLTQLPASCYEAALMLEKDRKHYEKGNVFPPYMLDKLIEELKSHDDKGLSEKLFGNQEELKKLVDKFIHCG